MAPLLRSAVVRFDALPEPVLRILFLALPVDERSRAACVCRGWRAFLADSSLWQLLDLTPAGGVAPGRVTENLVRGAVARAGGTLRILRLPQARPHTQHGTLAQLRLLAEVVRSDGGSLREVHTPTHLSVIQVAPLLTAAPHLHMRDASLEGTCEQLLGVMQRAGPLSRLDATAFEVFCSVPRAEASGATVVAVSAAVAQYEPLRSLIVSGGDCARGLNSLIDAAGERRVSRLWLRSCSMDDESYRALERMAAHNSLSRLALRGPGFPHEHNVPRLCATLQACRALTELSLGMGLQGGAAPGTVTQLLAAAATLPSLLTLELFLCHFQDAVATGHSLGAFLASNLPSLRRLNVQHCEIGDGGLAPLLDGLALNTHLHHLGCRQGNDVSEAFLRDRLEPALAVLAARRAATHATTA